MNPIAIIMCASALVTGVGLLATQEPETDTWGLVPESTVYLPSVGSGMAPDAIGSDTSAVTPYVQYEGPGCSEWADTAVRAGFQLDDLRTALQVMELESMCLPGAIGDNGDSFGLMQIHTPTWCQPNKYWPRGYLQTKGMINDCRELLEPLTNIWVAWHIASNYGWQNWTTYRRIDG